MPLTQIFQQSLEYSFADTRVGTGSLSSPSIFSHLTSETVSAMDGEMSTQQEAQIKPEVERKRIEGEELATTAQGTANPHKNIGVQDVTTGEDKNVVDSKEPTPIRICYNNGYGDFYFGRLKKWEKENITEDMSEEDKLDLMGITGSNGVPVVELDNFQRYNSFHPDSLFERVEGIQAD